MPVIESVEAGKDSFKLTFDDGSVLDVGAAYLPPEYEGAFLGTDAMLVSALSSEAEVALRHAAECRSAEKTALRLVIRAEQCAAGLEIKLEQRRHSPAVVRAVLERLLELNLVNDARYAELWLKHRVNRCSRGPRVLASKLRAKGIDRKIINAVFDTALTKETEAALLRRCLEKAGFTETAGDKDRDSELRYFLKTEGFSRAAIDGFFEDRDQL